ncbi:MAG TPA: universal stress protein [Gemmatimonadaceae bacterium]|nr:universal stress protein [Gemmatimonadaceae bacterium]
MTASGNTDATGVDATLGSSDFLRLLESRERGKLKVYIGSFAGVGKTYRMLQEGNALRARGIDVVAGFVESHGRAETEAQLVNLEVIPRRRVEYRGVVLEEMDVDAVIARAPAVALVDELAHTNVPGGRHTKRWQDVEDILDAGISVISAVNIQHVESLNDVVQQTLGVTVRETVPDWVLAKADQVVNLDISAEDLRQRLLEGKIYAPEKIQSALTNFFTEENLTTLRELALREVASSVDRIREGIAARGLPSARNNSHGGRTADRILVAMSSNPPYTQMLLRKASRIAGRLNSDWYCVYVQTPSERSDRIDAALQRRLVENIQAAQSMGAEIVKLEGADVAAAICQFAREKSVTLAIVGQSRRSFLDHIRRGSVIDKLINNTQDLDVLVAAFNERPTTTTSQ